MDVPTLLRLAFDAVIVIVGVAYAAGRRRERLEARGIKSQLAEHKAWQEKYEQEIERRFDEASERWSTLTSKIQTMCVEYARASERLSSVDARLTNLETRHTHFVESGGHGKLRG